MRLIFAIFVMLVLSACGDHVPTGGPDWKESDKLLTCQQLLLEMNDAKHWNRKAHAARQMGITDYLLPVSYLSTRMSANDAIATTAKRINRLQDIYQIKGCAQPYPGTDYPR